MDIHLALNGIKINFSVKKAGKMIIKFIDKSDLKIRLRGLFKNREYFSADFPHHHLVFLSRHTENLSPTAPPSAGFLFSHKVNKKYLVNQNFILLKRLVKKELYYRR